MSLAVRIIPTLCFKGANLLKGEKFNPWRKCGHVLQQARIYANRGVDELFMADVYATSEGREPDYKLIEDLTADTFTPVTVAGGIRTVQHAQRLLAAGADKVAIGRAFIDSPYTAKLLADRFGSQAVVVAIDYEERYPAVAEHLATRARDMGAGEIMLTNKDREGTMAGYDLKTIKAVAHAFHGPVIAHGGCKGPQDMKAAIEAGASAVAAGALFQWTDATPLKCAQALQAMGIEVRIPETKAA